MPPDARVVDRDAQRPELARRGDGALGELLVGNVPRQARGSASGRQDLGRHGLQADRVNVGDEDRGAVRGQQARDRAPDSRACPGDDRGASPYVVCGHASSPSVILLP
jgi:hypothetical protein